MAINPDLLVDRRPEQDLFTEIVTNQSQVRVLVFAVPSGRGKSSLMQRLNRNCQTMSPPTLSALIHVKKPEAKYDIKTAYDLAGAIVEELCEEDEAAAYFEHFMDLQRAYMGGDREAFGFAENRTSNTYNVKARVQGLTDSNVTAVNITPSPPDDAFNDEQRKFAEKKCVNAFLDDISRVIDGTPTAILIDGWDGCDLELRWWVHKNLVKPHIAEAEGGPSESKLHLVVAGLPFSADCPTGISDTEFSAFFDGLAYAKHVLRWTSFSRIEECEDDVSAFMQCYGGGDIPTQAVASYRPAIAEAMKVNLVNAIGLVRSFRAIYAQGGGLSA